MADLLADDEKRNRMEAAVEAFARADANRLIYDDLMQLVAQKGQKKGGEPLPEIPDPDVMPE